MDCSAPINVALARAVATLVLIPANVVLVGETGLSVEDLRLLVEVVDPREVTAAVAMQAATAAKIQYG